MRLVQSCAAIALFACGPATPVTTSPTVRPSGSVAATPVASASSSAVPAPPRVSDRGAVSTENAAAADAAMRVLESGGRAADAAIAAVLVAGVVQPASTGLGGDGFAVTWDAASKKTSVVDFRVRAPSGLKSVDHLGRETVDKKRGVMIGVPGVVAGLGVLYAMEWSAGTKKAWADLVTPAAELAENGFKVSGYAAQAFTWLREDALGRTLLATWGLDGASEDLGEATLHNTALGKTLRALTAGPNAFYKGDVAKDVVDSAASAGSRLVASDLSTYSAIVREPLIARWNGYDVAMPPAPCAGSLVVAEMLGLFSAEDVKALGRGSGDLVHLFAEGLRSSGEDRLVAIGDPDFTKMDADTFLDPASLAKRRAAFKKDTTTMPKRMGLGKPGTFHVVVVDAWQNAVSITTTVGDLFGARVMTAGGFPLNDALVDFTMDEYGQRPTNRGPNFPRGGARPMSTMTPTIVTKDGALVSALGASGGYRVPAAVVETLFDALAFGASTSDAVSSARFYTTPTGTLLLDPGLATLKEDLAARGEIVEDRKGDFAAVSAIGLRREAGLVLFDAAADARKSGVGRVLSGTP